MLQTPPQVPLSISYIIVGTVIILFFVIFFYLFFIQMQRRRAMYEKEMYELKTQYEKAILQSQLEIQEQTLRNISQEIHDNIGQVLSLAKLNLNTISDIDATDKIAVTEELLGKAINDLRDLSRSLHPEKISDIGLINAIQHELQIIQRAAKIVTEFTGDEKDLKLSNEKSIIVFRMIQEILHNILKHAKAKKITVSVEENSNTTFIEIKDDGKGFDLDSLKSIETGIGLKSIQQRCAYIDAQCKLDSHPGVGTSVQLIVNS